MSRIGSTLYLTPDKIDELTGIPGIAHTVEDGIYNFYLSTWFDSMENLHEYIIFQADGVPSPWTKICINYSDSIIIATDADGPKRLGNIEREIVFDSMKTVTQKKTLALIHPSSTVLPENTSDWLRERPVDLTLHLRKDRESDFSRMARILTDNAICLVLSGGGARGFAHIGVIRALEEQGIPIDMVGGTSQGAGLGLGIAFGYKSDEILRLSKKGFVDYNPLRDYTFPLVSILRGKKVEKVHKESCGTSNIEDLWVNFFCISCNLSKSEINVIDRGPAWKALRATSAIPGLVPPVIYNGCLHVDGGVVNNFPIDIMKKRVKGIIIASDTSFEDTLRVDEETYPGPLSIILRKLNPFTRKPPIPTIMDILMQATTISSMEKKRLALDDADLYLQPPVINYGILDMKKADDIAEVGYRYALTEIVRWKRSVNLHPDVLTSLDADTTAKQNS
jgi:NTE family protein/lysophospholipid hydrolase